MSAPSAASTAPASGPAGGPSPLALRIGLALCAILLVLAVGALLAWLFVPPTPPPRPAPFGIALPESGPSAMGGVSGLITTFQSAFYEGLRNAVAALRESGAALPGLVGLGFAYGVFHAAGPGHGKAVIAAYLVADDRAAWKGFALSLAAALLQALVAITLVGTAVLVLSATARDMAGATRLIETASFAAVAAMGGLVVWRKAGRLARLTAFARGAPLPADETGCVHLPPPETLSRMHGLREQTGVVVAAGLRPCAGAVLVLVFALSQGLFWAGIAATLAMAMGTALTTGVIAGLAVGAKRLALRLAGGRGLAGTLTIAGLELAAGAFVLVVGVALLVGVSAIGAI